MSNIKHTCVTWEVRSGSVEYGVRSAASGVRSAHYGVRRVACGVRRVECGVRSAEYGVRRVDYGVRRRSAACGLRSADRNICFLGEGWGGSQINKSKRVFSCPVIRNFLRLTKLAAPCQCWCFQLQNISR